MVMCDGTLKGDYLSWLEHLLCKQGVNGSNPLFSTYGKSPEREEVIRPRNRKAGQAIFDMLEAKAKKR